MYFIFLLSVFEVAPLLVLYVLIVTCEYVSLNWGFQWDQRVLDLCKYILSFLCKYVSQSWSSSRTRIFCLQWRYVSLKVSQGQNVFVLGGFEVNLGNKACKYVQKYFFVFLSIVFLSTANSLQTTNYLIFI